MGESQCPLCHHVVTGFEKQEFEMRQATARAKDAEIEHLRREVARLLNQLALFPVKHPQQAAERQAAKDAINF